MKIRYRLVSNSSSSSYYIKPEAKGLPVWKIFLSAAQNSPGIEVDLTTDRVHDIGDGTTQWLCQQLGVDINAILEEYSYTG